MSVMARTERADAAFLGSVRDRRLRGAAARLAAPLRAAGMALVFVVSGASAGLAGSSEQLKAVDLDEYLGQSPSLGDCLAGKAEGCGGKAAEAARTFSRSELCDLKIADGEACEPTLGKSRSMRAGERSRLLIVEEDDSEPLPSIDVEILFASDSADPLPASGGELQALAEAVADPRFSGDRFVVIGHTDAAGSDAYNQALSTRRAAAVRDRLVDLSGEGEERFIVAGRGESDLKNGVDPLAAENRRVQIVLLK
ncbi:OmpA family protein [Jiella endophytica]|uniref:OmpA family protein n=2 Tax=Jiella endophytica TaxID=2558362 RepID=A0A4Y8RL75_9HYPH|nr:OmpA family protein [Jiella endophytica]